MMSQTELVFRVACVMKILPETAAVSCYSGTGCVREVISR